MSFLRMDSPVWTLFSPACPPPAGEVAPDSGDALVCGRSLLQQPAAARQMLGYCPQARYEMAGLRMCMSRERRCCWMQGNYLALPQ